MKKFLILIVFFTIFSCKQDDKPSSSLTTNTHFEKAKKYKQKNLSDSAFYHYNLAKNSFLEANDSTGAARALVNMAFIQNKNGDFFGSIETSLEANKFLRNENDTIIKKTLASSYNNIAICSNSLQNFDSAFQYYNKTLQYVNNSEAQYICYNNMGDMLMSQGKIKAAKKYLEKAILADSAVNYARALNNFAKAKYLDDKNYNPLPELYKALKIRQAINDDWGKNSSFETLSTYYLDKDRNLSLDYAQKMLKVATENKSSDDQILALQRIIFLDPVNYLKNFKRLTSIDDSLQIARNKHKSQFAIVRYDVEQRNAQNQTLKVKSFKQTIGIVSLIIVLVIVYFWNEKRKKNIRREKEQEKQLEVKNTELKYSKKVHDVVANGLYHLMTNIENNPQVDRFKILNDMEKMYEESRDIAHQNIIEKDFSSRFSQMISSYSSPEQKVLIVGYKEEIWKNISANTQLELFYILRELLVNMKRHSHAKLVSLKFEKNNNLLKIKYTDNGIGIQNLGTQKGTGIQNTENRIAAVGGDINFEENPTGGLIVQITIPINSKYV